MIAPRLRGRTGHRCCGARLAELRLDGGGWWRERWGVALRLGSPSACAALGGSVEAPLSRSRWLSLYWAVGKCWSKKSEIVILGGLSELTFETDDAQVNTNMSLVVPIIIDL